MSGDQYLTTHTAVGDSQEETEKLLFEHNEFKATAKVRPPRIASPVTGQRQGERGLRLYAQGGGSHRFGALSVQLPVLG